MKKLKSSYNCKEKKKAPKNLSALDKVSRKKLTSQIAYQLLRLKLLCELKVKVFTKLTGSDFQININLEANKGLPQS
jgi:hypothetical protein